MRKSSQRCPLGQHSRKPKYHQGWIKARGRDGGKEQVITVTPAGRKLLASMHRVWQKAQQEASWILGEQGVAAVHRLRESVRKREG